MSIKQEQIDKDFRREADFINKLSKFIILFIAGLILSAFLGYACIAFFLYSTVSKVSFKNGIKPVIEDFWCGSPGCLYDSNREGK